MTPVQKEHIVVQVMVLVYVVNMSVVGWISDSEWCVLCSLNLYFCIQDETAIAKLCTSKANCNCRY